MVLDAATGRTLHTYQSAIHGSGKVDTPIGKLPATMHGTGSGGAEYTWTRRRRSEVLALFPGLRGNDHLGQLLGIGHLP